MKTIVNEFATRLDSKKRITLRGAKAEYYAVRMFEDGKVLLEPRVLVPPEAVSKRTLKMMDQAAENIRNAKVSEPIDLDSYL